MATFESGGHAVQEGRVSLGRHTSEEDGLIVIVAVANVFSSSNGDLFVFKASNQFSRFFKLFLKIALSSGVVIAL